MPTRCECYDPGCPATTHAPTPGLIVPTQCTARGEFTVTRYDYDPDGDSFLMCETCTDDALESGLFSTPDEDDASDDDVDDDMDAREVR